VSIPDNTILHLSEPFTKTWRIQNNGTCTWTPAYKLVFVGGDQMGSPISVPLPINIAPQQAIDIPVNMIAPDAPGHYEGLWQLQDASGKIFGVGESASEKIWVKVRVIAPAFSTPTSTPGIPTGTLSAASTATLEGTPAPQVSYSFGSNPCDAQWQSNTGILGCPGTDGSASGFVLRMEQARLEDGTVATAPSLLTFPQDAPDGYILGVYPEYEVKYGDHFQAAVGCEKDADACSVLFRLSYLDAASQPHDLWTLGEFYDGKYFNLDLDLSQLAGQKIKFILNVSSLGSAAGDRALWVDPRIMHFQAVAPTPVDTATATPAPTSSPTPSPTPTTPPMPTAPPSPEAPTPTAVSPSQVPSVQQILDSILSFFQQLFGGQ
jgi:hypothetical protein